MINRLFIWISTWLILLGYQITLAVPNPTDADMVLLISRRKDAIIRDNYNHNNAVQWKSSMNSAGYWTAIDYTVGCDARNANWPAITHLQRTVTLASAYAMNTVGNSSYLQKAKAGLQYWITNDYTELECMTWGGRDDRKCPCGTPGFWNKNWFPNTISVPKAIGNICLLLKDNLSTQQLNSCTAIQTRAFDRVLNLSPNESTMTGANLLDVASLGITLGLQTNNSVIVQQAIDIIYGAVIINPTVAADGIQSDGSFMQHAGLLYNGNYGKDFINDLLSVFIETKDTTLIPPTAVENTFAHLLAGTEWMIMANLNSPKASKLMWQYSTIGRMVSFKYSDNQASGGVAINVDKIIESADDWIEEEKMDKITDRLVSTPENANQGNLVGTRYFYDADYLVHRAPNYITTLKMYSSRTVNSECVNTQNPYGFHLSDGNIYNYLVGDEYIDVFGAWNWELIPGITTDYGGTKLHCGIKRQKGLRSFVGGATDLNMGIAVMDFVNPLNENLSFKKTFFFFPSGYAVQIGPTESKNTTAQLVTVLDQRRRNGHIFVDGVLRNTNTTYATLGSKSIWHDSVGYYFPTKEPLFVDSRPRNASWEDIGISSGNDTQQLWTSYIKHATTNTTGLLTQYIVQPGISHTDFHLNVNNNAIPIALDFRASLPQVNAAYSEVDNTIAIAFWTAGVYDTPWKSTSITSDTPCILMFREMTPNVYRLTVSNPTQLPESNTIKLRLTVGTITKTVTYNFPTDNYAGKQLTKTITYI